jgi:hypothetical protein
VVDRLMRVRQRTWPPVPFCGCGYLSWEALNKPAQFAKYIEETLARFDPVIPAPDEPILALLGVLE